MTLPQNFKQPTYLGYLAILRIAVGYHFLSVALPKISSAFPQGKILVDDFAKTVLKDPIGLHRDFILNFVAPHAAFFGHLVAYGELAIGLSLLFGCLVRLSASFAASIKSQYPACDRVGERRPPLAIHYLYIVMEIVFVLASAGLALGLDGLLKKRLPRTWLF